MESSPNEGDEEGKGKGEEQRRGRVAPR